MLLEDIIPLHLSQASVVELKEIRFELAQKWSRTKGAVMNASDVLDKYELILTELCSRGLRCHSLFGIDTALALRKEYISKPYPNEHAARVHSPEKYDYMRRTNDKFGEGIHVIFGIVNGKSEIQAIRFDKTKFNVEEAKEWLKSHNISYVLFEPARGQEDSKQEDQEQEENIVPSDKKDTEEKTLENNDTSVYSSNVLVEIKVFKSDKAEQLVSSVVYEPDIADTDGDYTDAEVLRKAMIAFMKQPKKEFNVEHEGKSYALPIIENWQPRQDFICEDGQVVRKGSWCMTIFVPHNEIWDAVVGGELRGYSLEGFSQATEVE